MKIDRLIGILSVLLQQEMTTAPELAERFHCSIRTVMNDVNFLTDKYPIYTVQGNGGGIRVMEGRELHRRNLKRGEEDALRKVLDRRPLDGEDLQQIRNIPTAFSSKHYL